MRCAAAACLIAALAGGRLSACLAADGAADGIEVEQARDRFVNFVLGEIETARSMLPEIAKAADAAAERIVGRDGQLLSAGDQSFSLEPVWRAGGIAFSRQYLPEKQKIAAEIAPAGAEVPYYRTKEFIEHFTAEEAKPDDVVLLGYESETQEQRGLRALGRQLLDDEALVVFFGSPEAAKSLAELGGASENLFAITHEVPDGGILQIEGWPEKVCSGRSIANRLYLWTFEAELIGACMRRGKLPGILLSVTYESPQIWNIPLLYSYRFIPAFDVAPVKFGALGGEYLDHL